jgi:F0F1-type ATP synthase membrane subunit a
MPPSLFNQTQKETAHEEVKKFLSMFVALAMMFSLFAGMVPIQQMAKAAAGTDTTLSDLKVDGTLALRGNNAEGDPPAGDPPKKRI